MDDRRKTSYAKTVRNTGSKKQILHSVAISS